MQSFVRKFWKLAELLIVKFLLPKIARSSIAILQRIQDQNGKVELHGEMCNGYTNSICKVVIWQLCAIMTSSWWNMIVLLTEDKILIKASTKAGKSLLGKKTHWRIS